MLYRPEECDSDENWEGKSEEERKESVSGNINSNIDSNINNDYEGCKIPTPENPFMNPTFEDYENGNLKKACNSYDNTLIRELENEYF